MKNLLLAAFAALMLGAFAPGCYQNDWAGRICAAPATGGEYCVPSNSNSPAKAAWDKAKANGPLPIQMWAEWPEDMTLDELVASRDKLDLWFADIDKILTYLRVGEKNAESYQASMAGRLGALLAQAKQRQVEFLEQKPIDAAGNFTQALTDKANAEKSPLLATLAGDKQAMAGVQAVLDKAKSDAAPLAAKYTSLVTEFSAYRASEAAETAAYKDLAVQASAASLDALAGIEQAILAAATGASAKPNDLVMGAMTLSAEIQAFEVSAQEAIAPQADVLSTHGARLPDMSSSALRSLNAMLGYVQQRVARSDATAMSLLAGIALRRQALVLLQTSPLKGEAVAQERQLRASSAFSKTASERVAALSKTLETSARLKLPYLAARVDELTALLQLQPLCDPSSSGWREAGCTSLRTSFQVAATSLSTTLPMLITTGLSTMRTTGMNAGLLDAAQAKLNAGDVKAAAVLHDAALRSVEAP